MVYMGSKSKYAKYIVPILQKCIDENNITTYVEPFCGGCNIIDKIKCENRYAFDKSDTLIALLSQAAEDFDKIPNCSFDTREHWDEGKEYVKTGNKIGNMSLMEIGCMEFFASFCKGGFARGYAKRTEKRNYYDEAYRNLQKQAPLLKGITFKCQEYDELKDIKNAVIYIDPPYQNTKTYGYARQGKMDYEHFWNWVRELSKDNFVFISEQHAPDDFVPIWTQEVKRTTNKTNDFKAVENLFVWKEKKLLFC